MTLLRDTTLTIVGLGLMGGSLGAAVRARGLVRRVIGVARRAETVHTALERGIVDEATLEATAAVAMADLIVFATPVRTTISLLTELSPAFQPGCVVTDMGSTKRAVLAAMGALPSAVGAVGGHPMCGKEVAGLDAADADLFEGKLWVLAPRTGTPSDVVHRVRDLAQGVGARILVLDPDRHDRLTATISHLPYALSAALVNAALACACEDSLTWKLAASGFRDTSRLAASDTRMMRDILMTNPDNVRRCINLLRQQLDELETCLVEGDEERLTNWMARARTQREGMFQ